MSSIDSGNDSVYFLKNLIFENLLIALKKYFLSTFFGPKLNKMQLKPDNKDKNKL